MTEDQLIDRRGKMVVNGKHGNADDLLARAKQRAIQNSLPLDDAYLAGI